MIIFELVHHYKMHSLREKCPNTEFFWCIFFCIQSKYGKIRTRKTPHWDTFLAVIVRHTNTIAHETFYTFWRHRKGLIPNLYQRKRVNALRFHWIKNLILVSQKKIDLQDQSETVARRCFIKKVFLEISQNSPKNTCAKVSVLLKKRQAQVFSCEFCEISKSTFSYRTPPLAASHQWSD